jgi:hypothetical protein
MLWDSVSVTIRPYQYGALSEDLLATFERSNGITLPLEYRDFLLDCNGGLPCQDSKYVFLANACEPLCDVHYFYGIFYGEPKSASL